MDADSVEVDGKDEAGWFAFFEKEWGGKGFVNWKTYAHAQLGKVEIGGWCGFYKKNPPPGERLEEVCEKQALFTLDVAEMTPRIQIRDVEIGPIQIMGNPTSATSAVGSDGTIIISKRSTKIATRALLAAVKIKLLKSQKHTFTHNFRLCSCDIWRKLLLKQTETPNR